MANGGALLRDFLWWWARQMRSLLPGFALPRGRFADALLVDVEGAPAPQFVHLSLRRRRREVIRNGLRCLWEALGSRSGFAPR